MYLCYTDGQEDTVSLRDLASAGDELGFTSLSECCPLDTSTDYEETKTGLPYEYYEEALSSGQGFFIIFSGDVWVSQKKTHLPSDNAEDEQTTCKGL